MATSYDNWKTTPPNPLPDDAAQLERELDAIRACGFMVDWSLGDYDGTLPQVVTVRLEETLATDRRLRPPAELAECLLGVISRLVNQGIEVHQELIEQISELHRLVCLAQGATP